MKTKLKLLKKTVDKTGNTIKVTLYVVPNIKYQDYLDFDQKLKLEKLLTLFLDSECYYGGFVATGIAKCHPDDKFDEVIGIKIAESRAKIKIYNKAYKFYSLLIQLIMTNIMNILNTREAVCNVRFNELEHLKKLLEE